MNKTTYIWIILISLTTITLFLGENESFTSTVLILVSTITLLKGQLVIDYFMGLKDVKSKYRFFVSFWLFFVLSSITIIYIL